MSRVVGPAGTRTAAALEAECAIEAGYAAAYRDSGTLRQIREACDHCRHYATTYYPREIWCDHFGSPWIFAEPFPFDDPWEV